MSTFSIREALLGDNPDPVDSKATSLIRLLLKAAASTAENAGHGMLSGFSIVLNARESCDKIDATMEDIDAISELNEHAEENGWDLFDKYVEGIRELERLLLDELGIFDHPVLNLSITTVEDGLTQTGNWETHRDQLHKQLNVAHKVLQGVHGQPKTDAPKWEQHRDDEAILHQLLTLLKSRETETLGGMGVSINELQTVLYDLEIETRPDDTTVDCVKAAWLIHAATLEELEPSTGAQRKRYLGLEKVWDEVKAFAGVIRGKDDSQVRAAYTELCRVLRGDELPPDVHYLNIIKASKSVMRPFMYQNRTLLKYCRELVKLYNKADKEDLRAANEAHVLSALKHALEAARLAKAASPNAWIIDATSKEDATKAYAKAVDGLKQSLGKYSAQDMVTRLEAEMGTALTDDNNRFDVLKNKCQAVAITPPRTGTPLLVTIKADGSEVNVTVDGSTKIRALIWRQNRKDSSKVYTGAKVDGDKVDIEKTVTELNSAGGFELELTE